MSADGDASELSAKERAALEQFRQAVAGLSTPCKEDWYLLKWLRARKFELNDAEKMLREHIAWRKKHEVDTILEDYEVPELFRKYFPGGFLECSPDKRPVIISPVGNTDFKGMLEAAPRADMVRYCVYLFETLEDIKRRLSLQHTRRIETMYVVVDMEGFSFWQLSSLEVVSAITEMIRVYEDNYPEVLQEVFIVNAPSLFPMLWNIIKPLLTQRTINKIHIFGKEGWRELLAERWDPDRLPAHWGGRMTGPDGDRRCKHLICPAGPVPDEYRRQGPATSDTQQRTTVGAGSSWTLPVSVARAGSVLRWNFSTASGELAFAVRYRAPGTGDNGVARELLASRRFSSSRHEPHHGSLRCNEPGTYELVFDNTFSWITRKEVSYSVQLLPPATPDCCLAESDDSGKAAPWTETTVCL